MEGYTYREGLKDGIPIALGYLLVSTGFGITAVNCGLPVITSVLISMTNLTSAGQVAGVEIIRDLYSGVTVFAVSALEMLIATLMINLRYSLMAVSLSQKLDGSFTTGRRLLTGFFITDEIYAVASSKKGDISSAYMLGLGTLPFFGWAAGTAAGAVCASLMPAELSNVFGIAIYGMFLSIVVPDCRKSAGVLLCSVCAASLSCLLRFVPSLSVIPSGFRVIICALASSLAAAALFPREEEAEDE